MRGLGISTSNFLSSPSNRAYADPFNLIQPRRHAWGHDELKPVSNGFTDSHNGWGATIFDSLCVTPSLNLLARCD